MPTSIVVCVALAATLALVAAARLTYKVLKKIRSESRHDRAVEATEKNITALQEALESAGPCLSGSLAPARSKRAFNIAKRSAAELSALQDQYYVQGATIAEWERIAKQAAQLRVSLTREQLRMETLKQVAEKAGEALRKAEDSLSATDKLGPYRVNNRPVDLTEAHSALQASRACWEHNLFQASLEQAGLVPTLIKRAEVLAMLESVDERLSQHAEKLDAQVLEKIETHLTGAWIAFQSGSPLDKVWAKAEAADSSLAVAIATMRREKDQPRP